MTHSNSSHSHRSLFLFTALAAVLALAGCVRKDGGAPVYWSSGYAGPQTAAPVTRKVTRTAVTPAAPAAQRQVAAFTPGAAIEPSRYDIVVVRPGDTLYHIAKTHDSSVAELADLNRLNASHALKVGQLIRAPQSSSYAVASGDTVYSISKRYGVSVQELASVNRISKPYRIKIGQQIEVPTRTATAGIKRIRVVSPAATSPAQSSSWRDRVNERAVPKSKPAKASQNATWSPSASKPKADKGFLWPVNGRVISAFGTKQNGLHNDGINIAVKSGAKVHAARSGVVTYAGNELKGYGNLLLIKHADGFVTAYAHNKRFLVRRGDRVTQGQEIAEAGDTGAVSTPQVHFEIRKGRNAVNPSKYLTGA